MAEALGTRCDAYPRVIQGHTPQGLILANAMLSAWHSLPESSIEGAAAAGRLLVGAMAGLLGGAVAAKDPASPTAMAVDDATLDALQAFIERHLADPELTPELLCRKFHCSRATLYRLFAPLGGVAQFIRRARLQRAYDELMLADERETIINVALRWGFGSLNNFGRLFRETFGVTPREVREAGRAIRHTRAEPGEKPHRSRLWLPEYRQWLEKI